MGLNLPDRCGSEKKCYGKAQRGKCFYVNTWKGALGSQFVVKSKMAIKKLGWMV